MTRIERIADLLMGAAHADRELDGRELDAVKHILCELTKAEALSPALLRRLERFRPAKLNIAETCSRLDLQSDDERRHLLELLTAVQEADEVWDLDEDAYLHRVAKAIGATPSLLEGLAVSKLEFEAIGAKLLRERPARGS